MNGAATSNTWKNIEMNNKYSAEACLFFLIIILNIIFIIIFITDGHVPLNEKKGCPFVTSVHVPSASEKKKTANNRRMIVLGKFIHSNHCVSRIIIMLFLQ